jgi:iron complex outermembrane receptor protein
MWGPKHGDSHTFGAAELYKTDGFGQNRDARRGSAIGQYEGHFGERSSYRITGQAYTTTYHSAGVLREDDYDAGRVKFFDTYDTRQGGESSRFSVAADVEGHAGEMLYKQQLFFVSRAMRLRENFTGFLLDVQTPLQSPHSQRGDLLDLNVDETTIGARGSARLHTHALGEPQELELGYFARGDSVRGSQQRIEAATGNPYRTETDVESKLGDIGIYGDANLRPLSWLTFRGGARADLFTYGVLDKCAVQSVAHPSKTAPPGDASCLHQEDFGHYREPSQRSGTAATAVMPRGSLLMGPFQHFTLSASYGRGVRSIDPIYVTQDSATPFASVTAYEGGVTYAGGTSTVGVVARSIFFRTEVERDLVFSESAGRNVLGGGTSRTGWVGALRMQGAFFDQSANVTLVRSTFDDTHLLVPYVPDLVLRSDTSLFHDMPFSIAREPVRGILSAGVTYVGRRPLPYGQRSDTIFTMDAQATLGWTNWELGLAMTNLFGNRYRLGEFNYASDFHSQAQSTLVPMRHFTAGAPRAVFVSLAATFGGP